MPLVLKLGSELAANSRGGGLPALDFYFMDDVRVGLIQRCGRSFSHGSHKDVKK